MHALTGRSWHDALPLEWSPAAPATRSNQYWLHYRLLDNWGYKDLAKTWRKQSIEEMWHADKLIERIIFLDGAPNMQTLDSLHIGKTEGRAR
jgi:bacterioferritin